MHFDVWVCFAKSAMDTFLIKKNIKEESDSKSSKLFKAKIIFCPTCSWAFPLFWNPVSKTWKSREKLDALNYIFLLHIFSHPENIKLIIPFQNLLKGRKTIFKKNILSIRKPEITENWKCSIHEVNCIYSSSPGCLLNN